MSKFADRRKKYEEDEQDDKESFKRKSKGRKDDAEEEEPEEEQEEKRSSKKGGKSRGRDRDDRKGKKSKKDKAYVKVASILDGEFGEYIGVDKDTEKYQAKGRLLYFDYDEEKFYELKSLAKFEVNDRKRDFVLADICFDKLNEKHATDVTDEFE